MFAKSFLVIHLFEEIIAEFVIYYVNMENIQHSGLYNKCNTMKDILFWTVHLVMTFYPNMLFL